MQDILKLEPPHPFSVLDYVDKLSIQYVGPRIEKLRERISAKTQSIVSSSKSLMFAARVLASSVAFGDKPVVSTTIRGCES